MTSQEEYWRQFIRSDRHAGRYLSGGGSVQLTRDIAVGSDTISDLLDRFNRTDTIRLVQLFFLLQADFVSFVTHSLPQLLRSMSHVRLNRRDVIKGAVKGKIAWEPTIRRTLASGRAEPAYVVDRPDRTADTPENQLIKRLAVNALHLLADLRNEMGSGPVERLFFQLESACFSALRSPQLKGVSPVRRFNAVMKQRARRHKDRRYTEAVDLALRLQSCIELQEWQAISELVALDWLEPIKSDDLFELYCLVLTIDIISDELGFGLPERYGLITDSRSQIASFCCETSGKTVDVFFDQSPSKVAGISSNYETLLDRYGFRGAPHRPDVVVRFNNPGEKSKYVLIEAKKTYDLPYQRHSLYKIFGYLKDFESLWANNDQYPKGLLLFPDGISPRHGKTHGIDDVWVISAARREDLVLALQTVSP